jgi:hypothetical protein
VGQTCIGVAAENACREVEINADLVRRLVLSQTNTIKLSRGFRRSSTTRLAVKSRRSGAVNEHLGGECGRYGTAFTVIRDAKCGAGDA